jgi:hypothetical protein
MNISATHVLFQLNFPAASGSLERLTHRLEVRAAGRAKLYVVTLI